MNLRINYEDLMKQKEREREQLLLKEDKMKRQKILKDGTMANQDKKSKVEATSCLFK